MASRILIIGGGNVAAALGRKWLECGHDVRYGVRDPAHLKYADLPKERLQRAHERRDAQIVVLATPFIAVSSAIKALGDLHGVVLIDCTNAIAMGPDGMQLLYGHDTSSAEYIASLVPGAAVFKTLHQTGAENMADAGAYHPPPVMFVAGDDAKHMPLVLNLVSDLGFEAVDAGPLIAARLLEPLALLWIKLAVKAGYGRDFAFALIRNLHTPHRGENLEP